MTSRAPQFIGAVAAIGILEAITAPYLSFAHPAWATHEYYTAWIIGPYVIAVLALLALIAFTVAVLTGYDPPLVAGGVFVFSLATFLAAITWAFAVPIDDIGGLSHGRELAYFRTKLVVLAGIATLSAVWYTKNVLGKDIR